MKRTSSKSKIIMIVLLFGVLPWLISFAAHLFIGDAKHVQEPVHEFFELAGTCIALTVTMLLLLHSLYDESSPHLLWVVAALMAMGLVDGVHSVLPFGLAWSWLRHSATLIGGLLFAMVWIPLPAVVIRRKHFFMLPVAVLAIAWSLLVMWRPELFPVPFLPEGYAFSVKATNALGGLGFLAASVFFLKRYLYGQQSEDMAFASQTLIFGTASLSFGFSHIWAADWWAWHVFRFMGYATVFVIVYNMLTEIYQIINTVREPLIALDQDLRVVTASRSFYEVFKVKPEETVGQLIYDLGNKQWNVPKLRELLESILPQKTTFDDYEVEHDFSTIGRRIMLLNARQMQRMLGKERIILLAIEDITERKEAEKGLKRALAALELSNKELESFSYSVSHDLRAPLRSIDGFSLALLEDYEDKLDLKGKDFLHRVRAATQNMAILIDDLLKLSQVTRSEIRLDNVDMSSLAHSIAESLQKSAPERRVTLLIQDGLTAKGDRNLLEMALVNLIENAWKFSSSQPEARIEFGSSETDGKQTYFVRDNGAGFDMTYVDKLFGAFQRLHSTKEFPGTGIGLATVQRIIHRHGGRVWAEGAVNKGATFYFTL